MPAIASPTPVEFELPANRDDELRSTTAVRFMTLPERRFLMIDGDGPPADTAFAARMPGLYATAYTLRFSLKRRGVVTRVGPLEGLWWTLDGETSLDAILGPAEGASRDAWRWTLLIGLPDEASASEIEGALETGRSKLAPVFAGTLRVEPFAEGRVAQVLHVGPYATEKPTIERLHAAIAAAGLRPRGHHHEIYLGDPRRSAPGRLRTIIRMAVE